MFQIFSEEVLFVHPTPRASTTVSRHLQVEKRTFSARFELVFSVAAAATTATATLNLFCDIQSPSVSQEEDDQNVDRQAIRLRPLHQCPLWESARAALPPTPPLAQVWYVPKVLELLLF